MYSVGAWEYAKTKKITRLHKSENDVVMSRYKAGSIW